LEYGDQKDLTKIEIGWKFTFPKNRINFC